MMKICITGGGTGGHLMVAQALAHAALEEGHEVIFIGSTWGQDRKYFQNKSDFSHVYFLETYGVVNKKGFAKFKALWAIFRAFLEARKILKHHKIDAAYSVGGFSAAPASFAILSLAKPLFIHEQNAHIGRLNSLLKPFAKQFVSAYDQNSPVSGYPVNEVFYKTAHRRKELKTIIFLGGSQGAKAINDLALATVKELQKKGLHVIHQAGEADLQRVEKEYERIGVEGVELYGFSTHLPQLISKADFAVSRAGASTLWELTTNGCVAMYVPYPYAAGNHQYYNAKFIVEHGMGYMYTQEEDLVTHLFEILDEVDLEQKSKKLISYAKKDVAREMIKQIEVFC